MISSADLLQADPSLVLKQWQDQAVLYHPESNSTLLISSLMYDALELLKKDPLTIRALSHHLDDSHGNNLQLEAILEDGLTALSNQGLLWTV